MRQRGVAVGRHEAPAWESLPRFLARWTEAYAGVRRGEASIVALTAAHHRLAWVHPFLDGNGRVTRLHTHLLLYAARMTQRLWSPVRRLSTKPCCRPPPKTGAATSTAEANSPRPASSTGMRNRIRAALAYEAAVVKSGVREEALRSLHYLFATQAKLGRADLKAMTALGNCIATSTVSALLQQGFLATDSPYGSLRFAVPRHTLRFYFPALWTDAKQEQALLEAERMRGQAGRGGGSMRPGL